MAEDRILRAEEAYHDRWADTIKPGEVLVDESFEVCTAPENRLIIYKIGDLRDKKILDLGCGAGEAAVYFAKKGARSVAVDISQNMLALVKEVARRHDVSVQTERCYSHELCFEDESFDIVYAANILHHVDIESALKDASRVLKKGGIFVSYDPLAYNPLINIYRRIVREKRTKDEHPFSRSDIKIFNKYFSHVEIDARWFFTLWIFVRFFLFQRVNPDKERYWKKILREHKELERTYCRLERIDRLLLKIFPFMKIFCWNVVVYAVK